MSMHREPRTSSRFHRRQGARLDGVALAIATALASAACAGVDEPSEASHELTSPDGATPPYDGGSFEAVSERGDIPTTFEEVLEVAGDALIVNDVPGSNAGTQSGMLERGTVYMRDRDVAAQVVVSASGVRVNTFVRGGGNDRHRVFISSACELTSHYYKDATFNTNGELLARCPPDYPIAFGEVSLADIP
jgi:hypothetical protein